MKMLVEKAALYRQHLASVKLPWPLLVGLFLLVSCAGCPSTTQPTNTPSNENSVSTTSTVPLRVWFVASPSDKPVIERQWQANYDQPIDITILKADDLLKQSKPTCDVLVYPAWMVGDLVTRDWLTELPARLQEKSPTTPEEDASVMPPGWLDQARFNRKQWGLSLSVLPTVVMANFEIPNAREVGPNESATADEAIAYWQSLAEALTAERSSRGGAIPTTPAEQAATVDIDAQAVCDRFMTILLSLSDHENIIGTLFHPDDLKPRVTNSNFVLTAEIMQKLHGSGADTQALLGSHGAAWSALTGPSPTVTIGLPPTPSPEVDKVSSIVASPPPATPAKAGMRVTAGWNSGRGLVVSISKQCRQTAVSIDFARWLASDTSRQVFSKRIEGLHAESAYAPGSSAWQAERIVQRLGQQSRLQAEPRLPQSLAYRQALGEQIANVVMGTKSVEAALADVEKSWQAITASEDPKIQIPAYVQSLGL